MRQMLAGELQLILSHEVQLIRYSPPAGILPRWKSGLLWYFQDR